MTLRSAVIGSDGNVERSLVDDMVCDCCQTSMTVSQGIPIVVYRDRTKGEIRDISFSRYIDQKWTEPQPIHEDGWKINGCPVNGPNIDSFEENVVSWFSASKGRQKLI